MIFQDCDFLVAFLKTLEKSGDGSFSASLGLKYLPDFKNLCYNRGTILTF